MFTKKRPYSCLVYPTPHPSLFPSLQPEQREFLNQWRHLLDQPPSTTSDAVNPLLHASSATNNVDPSTAAITSVDSALSSASSASLPPTDTAHSPPTPSLSASPTQPPAPDVSACPTSITRLDEVAGLWSSLATDESLPVVDAVTSFCSQLRVLLLHLHSLHQSDDCHCLPSVLDELDRTVLRTRAQLKPKRNQQQQLPPNTSSPSLPLDRHVQLQIVVRLALPTLPPPPPDTATTAATEEGGVAADSFQCDIEQLVELFELLHSAGSERDAVVFFRSVVVPAYATTQRDAIKQVCREMDWAQPLELREGQQVLKDEDVWEESDEEEQDDKVQLQPVQLTRTEILPTAVHALVQQPPSRAVSSASSATARTNSLPLPSTLSSMRRSSLPLVPSVPPAAAPTLYPPTVSASAALSQLRQQRMREQLRLQEEYERKRKRAREGITEEEEKARQKRQQQQNALALTDVQRFASNKMRIATRLPAAIPVRREVVTEETKTRTEAVTKRKGVRQLNFAAHGKRDSNASTDVSSARSSSLSSMPSDATSTDRSVSPVVAVSSSVEFVAETPMTRGVRGRASDGTDRSSRSTRLQRSGGRSKRNLTSMLEQQAVP